MITPAISHENFGGEFFSPENLKRFKVLNSTYVMLTADTHKSQGQPQRRREENPREPKWSFQRTWLPSNVLDWCYCCFKNVSLTR